MNLSVDDDRAAAIAAHCQYGDEIARRVIDDLLADRATMKAAIKRQNDAIATLESAFAGSEEVVDMWEKKHAEQDAEIERLRAALEAITNHVRVVGGGMALGGDEQGEVYAETLTTSEPQRGEGGDDDGRR